MAGRPKFSPMLPVIFARPLGSPMLRLKLSTSCLSCLAVASASDVRRRQGPFLPKIFLRQPGPGCLCPAWSCVRVRSRGEAEGGSNCGNESEFVHGPLLRLSRSRSADRRVTSVRVGPADGPFSRYSRTCCCAPLGRLWAGCPVRSLKGAWIFPDGILHSCNSVGTSALPACPSGESVWLGRNIDEGCAPAVELLEDCARNASCPDQARLAGTTALELVVAPSGRNGSAVLGEQPTEHCKGCGHVRHQAPLQRTREGRVACGRDGSTYSS